MTNQSPHVCRNGHSRTPGNTMLDNRGETKCRECHNANQARYRARKKAGLIPARIEQPRLPFEPLLSCVPPSPNDDADQIPGARRVAEMCRVTVRIARRWKRCGMELDEADAAAIALGMHPCEVWPEWWEVAA
jgi:hypothetical protein